VRPWLRGGQLARSAIPRRADSRTMTALLKEILKNTATKYNQPSPADALNGFIAGEHPLWDSATSRSRSRAARALRYGDGPASRGASPNSFAVSSVLCASCSSVAIHRLTVDPSETPPVAGSPRARESTSFRPWRVVRFGAVSPGKSRQACERRTAPTLGFSSVDRHLKGKPTSGLADSGSGESWFDPRRATGSPASTLVGRGFVVGLEVGQFEASARRRSASRRGG
jgi:hypothetical protein